VNRGKKDRKKHSRFFGVLTLFAGYCLAFTAAYGINTWVYRYTGQPHELVRHLLSGMIAVAIILVVWRLLLEFGGGRHREDQRGDRDQAGIRFRAQG